MTQPTLEKLDQIGERLSRQRQPAIQYIVFLKDLADDNSRWGKYKDSYAGHIINMNIVTAQNALILLCCRIWDMKEDAFSIPNAIKEIEENKDDLINRIAATENSQGRKALESRWRQKICEASTKSKRMVDENTFRAMRVMRTENLAHSLTDSRDRTAKFPNGFENHGVTRYDAYDFARRSIILVDEIEYLRTRSGNDYQNSASVFQKYCDAYWDALPVFRDLE